MKKPVTAAVAVLVAPLGLVLGVALAGGAASATTPALMPGGAGGTGGGLCFKPAAPGEVLADGVKLTTEQINNASLIHQVAVQLQLPAQASVIAIATAMQESTLVNITFGDRDSLGLFQQRPSQGWGTPAQIMDPVYSSKKFYSVLVTVPLWEALPVTVAAQRVQRSGFPDAYARWEAMARQLVTGFGGNAANCSTGDGNGGDDGATTEGPTDMNGFTLPPGTPVAVVKAIRFGLSKVGMPYQWGGTGNPSYDCSGLMLRAYEAGGVKIDRTTYEQVLNGRPIYNASDLRPGDLIFLKGTGTVAAPGHVGMYLGSDLVLDAPRTGKNLQVTRFTGGYWDLKATSFRRIVS
ncbi:C40 family peptidase [Kitasatospora sp. NPDC051853]|uniref:C40 family peptidase n=1 Tax=Kitasatospora sp. NPDC051853 TaxID=3364058 RepID=UPI0037AC2295